MRREPHAELPSTGTIPTAETFETLERSANRWRPSRWTVCGALALASVVGVGVFDTLVLEEPVRLPLSMTGRGWLLATFLVLLAWIGWPVVRDPRRLAVYWNRYPLNGPSVFGLGVVVTFFAVGVSAPHVLDPPTIGIPERMEQPPMFTSVSETFVRRCVGEVAGGRCYGTLEHPLGTDRQGRDIATYVAYGTRTALEMAVLVSMIAVPIAVAVGVTAAYAGGWIDAALMRYVDVQQVVPAFFVYFVLYFFYGPSHTLLIVVFGLFSWGGIARVVRIEVLAERERAYVLAARSAGAGRLSRIRRHILPNVAGTVVTAMTMQIPFLIGAEAALSFLDLGDPDVHSWGTLIARGADAVHYRPWVTLVPGACLSVTILGFYLFGDSLQEVFDSRSR